MISIVRSVGWLLALLLAYTAVVQPALAQEEVTATITAEPLSLTVGDPIQVTLEVSHPTGYQVQPPEVAWGDFELLRQSDPLASPPEGDWQTTAIAFQLTLWTPGAHELPSLPLHLVSREGMVVTAVTQPLTLTVYSVLSDDDLTLRDIRPQATLVLPVRQWPWLWPLLAAVTVAAAGWYYRQRRRRTAPVAGSGSAWLEASAALDELETRGWPAQGRYVEYATAIYDILRRLIEKVYALSTRFQSTDELLEALNKTKLAEAQRDSLARLLQEIEYVRFSGRPSSVEAARHLLAQARRFIQQAPALEDEQSR